MNLKEKSDVQKNGITYNNNKEEVEATKKQNKKIKTSARILAEDEFRIWIGRKKLGNKLTHTQPINEMQ